MAKMQGMSFASLKKHKALIPLYVCVGAGCVAALLSTFRTAVQNPDVAWSRNQGELSNEEYRKKQYKMFSPNVDYSKVESQAPKY